MDYKRLFLLQLLTEATSPSYGVGKDSVRHLKGRPCGDWGVVRAGQGLRGDTAVDGAAGRPWPLAEPRVPPGVGGPRPHPVATGEGASGPPGLGVLLGPDLRSVLGPFMGRKPCSAAAAPNPQTVFKPSWAGPTHVLETGRAPAGSAHTS